MDDLQKVLDEMQDSVGGARMQLVRNPLRDAMRAGQDFSDAGGFVHESYDKFLLDIGVPVDSESAGIIEKRNEAEFQAIQQQAHMAMYHEWQKLEQMEDVSASTLTDEFKLLALQKAWTEKRDSAFLEYSIQKQREICEAKHNFSQKVPNCSNRWGTSLHPPTGVGGAVFCVKLGCHKCLGCMQVSYCSKVCQEMQWPLHKNFCKKLKAAAKNPEAGKGAQAAAR